MRWHRAIVKRRWIPWPRSRAATARRLPQGADRSARARTPAGVARRIVGELQKLGLSESETSVRNLLRNTGLGPAPRRSGLTWGAFIRQQAASMIATDFFTVETAGLRRIYVLFFIELETRRVHLAGCTSRPHGTWVVQQARNFAFDLADRRTPIRFLLHDRDSKFRAAFDEVFGTAGAATIKTPIRAPNANA